MLRKAVETCERHLRSQSHPASFAHSMSEPSSPAKLLATLANIALGECSVLSPQVLGGPAGRCRPHTDLALLHSVLGLIGGEAPKHAVSKVCPPIDVRNLNTVIGPWRTPKKVFWGAQVPLT